MQIIEINPRDCTRWKYADRSHFEFGNTGSLSEDIKEILYEEYQAYLANTNRVLDTIKILFAEDFIDQEEDESGVTVF